MDGGAGLGLVSSGWGAGQGATDRGEGVVQVVDGPGDDDDAREEEGPLCFVFHFNC